MPERLNRSFALLAMLALAASTLIASILPAVRAILISPVAALRMD